MSEIVTVRAVITWYEFMVVRYPELIPAVIEQKLREQGIRIKKGKHTLLVPAEDLASRIEPPWAWQETMDGYVIEQMYEVFK